MGSRNFTVLELLTTGTAYAIFERTKKKFTDFDKVRDEIEAETALVAGSNKNIVDDPIKLEVRFVSPCVCFA